MNIDLFKYLFFLIISTLILWLLKIWLDKNKKKRKDEK